MKLKFLSIMSLVLMSANAMAVPAELQEMNNAYLNGDFRSMVTSIVSALKGHPHDPLVLKNTLELYNTAARASRDAGLPADWVLPAEITKMKVGVRRLLSLESNDSVRYKLKMSGMMVREKVIKQLQVTRYADNQVVLDKQAGIGTYEEITDKYGITYQLSNSSSANPIEAGLYMIHLELANGNKTEGYFILEESMNASNAPKIASPFRGEIIKTGTPTLQFEAYKTPEYREGDYRSLNVSIAKVHGDDWNDVYEYYEDEPKASHLDIGTKGDFSNIAKSLDNGTHDLIISYSETHKFGPIRIVRNSGTLVPFTVQK